MPLQLGKLKSGESIQVTFAAGAQNAGSSSVVIGHIPTEGTEPATFIVPEGTSQSRTLTVAKRSLLRIDVDVPEGGIGKLSVTQGTRSWTTPPVGGDTIWTFEIAG